MAEKLTITIIGLDAVGASAGLALRRFPDKVRVLGHDRRPLVAQKAKAMNAVERTEWNLINAASQADRILLAVPPGEVRDTLKAIGQDLKAGCLLLNMSSVNSAALEWAAEFLPDNVSMVGGYPVQLSNSLGTDEARADFFEGKLFCLTPDLRTADTAANLAADLAEALGARPFFLDPSEFDGLIAGVEHLPLVLAGALMQATTTGASWQDTRKLAGSQYYTSTLIVSEDPQAAASACIANRENLIRWIDLITGSLAEWRAMLEAEDEAKLTAILEKGLTDRVKWLQAQASGNWTETKPADIPDTGHYLRSLIGFGGGRERPKAKGK